MLVADGFLPPRREGAAVLHGAAPSPDIDMALRGLTLPGENLVPTNRNVSRSKNRGLGLFPPPPSINGSFLPERELDPDLIQHHRHRAEVNQQNTGASGEGIDPSGAARGTARSRAEAEVICTPEVEGAATETRAKLRCF